MSKSESTITYDSIQIKPEFWGSTFNCNLWSSKFKVNSTSQTRILNCFFFKSWLWKSSNSDIFSQLMKHELNILSFQTREIWKFVSINHFNWILKKAQVIYETSQISLHVWLRTKIGISKENRICSQFLRTMRLLEGPSLSLDWVWKFPSFNLWSFLAWAWIRIAISK